MEKNVKSNYGFKLVHPVTGVGYTTQDKDIVETILYNNPDTLDGQRESILEFSLTNQRDIDALRAKPLEQEALMQEIDNFIKNKLEGVDVDVQVYKKFIDANNITIQLENGTSVIEKKNKDLANAKKDITIIKDDNINSIYGLGYIENKVLKIVATNRTEYLNLTDEEKVKLTHYQCKGEVGIEYKDGALNEQVDKVLIYEDLLEYWSHLPYGVYLLYFDKIKPYSLNIECYEDTKLIKTESVINDFINGITLPIIEGCYPAAFEESNLGLTRILIDRNTYTLNSNIKLYLSHLNDANISFTHNGEKVVSTFLINSKLLLETLTTVQNTVKLSYFKNGFVKASPRYNFKNSARTSDILLSISNPNEISDPMIPKDIDYSAILSVYQSKIMWNNNFIIDGNDAVSSGSLLEDKLTPIKEAPFVIRTFIADIFIEPKQVKYESVATVDGANTTIEPLITTITFADKKIYKDLVPFKTQQTESGTDENDKPVTKTVYYFLKEINVGTENVINDVITFNVLFNGNFLLSSAYSSAYRVFVNFKLKNVAKVADNYVYVGDSPIDDVEVEELEFSKENKDILTTEENMDKTIYELFGLNSPRKLDIFLYTNGQDYYKKKPMTDIVQCAITDRSSYVEIPYGAENTNLTLQELLDREMNSLTVYGNFISAQRLDTTSDPSQGGNSAKIKLELRGEQGTKDSTVQFKYVWYYGKTVQYKKLIKELTDEAGLHGNLISFTVNGATYGESEDIGNRDMYDHLELDINLKQMFKITNPTSFINRYIEHKDKQLYIYYRFNTSGRDSGTLHLPDALACTGINKYINGGIPYALYTDDEIAAIRKEFGIQESDFKKISVEDQTEVGVQIDGKTVYFNRSFSLDEYADIYCCKLLYKDEIINTRDNKNANAFNETLTYNQLGINNGKKLLNGAQKRTEFFIGVVGSGGGGGNGWLRFLELSGRSGGSGGYGLWKINLSGYADQIEDFKITAVGGAGGFRPKKKTKNGDHGGDGHTLTVEMYVGETKIGTITVPGGKHGHYDYPGEGAAEPTLSKADGVGNKATFTKIIGGPGLKCVAYESASTRDTKEKIYTEVGDTIKKKLEKESLSVGIAVGQIVRGEDPNDEGSINRESIHEDKKPLEKNEIYDVNKTVKLEKQYIENLTTHIDKLNVYQVFGGNTYYTKVWDSTRAGWPGTPSICGVANYNSMDIQDSDSTYYDEHPPVAGCGGCGSTMKTKFFDFESKQGRPGGNAMIAIFA